MRHEHTASSKALRTILIAAAVLAPAVLISVLVTRHYVPIPFLDEWELAPLISADSVSIRGLFHQHNEHRSFFPKLILTVLGRSTGWSQRYEPALNIIFALVTVATLLQFVRPATRTRSAAMLMAGFTASVFLFSPAQYDVWLWPWMIVSTLTASLVCIAALGLASRGNLGFSGAVVCCAIASVSSAQGLFTWFALLPAAVWNSTEKQIDRGRTIIWTAAGIASWVLYFTGFKTSQTSAIVEKNLRQIPELTEFIIGVIGAPWTRSVALSVPVGLLQLVLFVWVGALVLKRVDVARALALLGVGAWVVFFAAASAAGRLQFGPDTALTSRYLASSALLPATFFTLVAILYERGNRRQLAWLVISALTVSATWIYTTHRSASSWEEITLDRTRGARCLGMSSQTLVEGNRCLELINPRPVQMIERVDALERAGVRNFRRIEPVPFIIERHWVGRLSNRISTADPDHTVFSGLLVDPTEVPNLGLIFLDFGESRLWCCGFTEEEFGIGASPLTGGRPASSWSAAVPAGLIGGNKLTAFALFTEPDRLSWLDGTLSLAPNEGPETVYSASQRGAQ